MIFHLVMVLLKFKYDRIFCNWRDHFLCNAQEPLDTKLRAVSHIHNMVGATSARHRIERVHTRDICTRHLRKLFFIVSFALQLLRFLVIIMDRKRAAALWILYKRLRKRKIRRNRRMWIHPINLSRPYLGVILCSMNYEIMKISFLIIFGCMFLRLMN